MSINALDAASAYAKAIARPSGSEGAGEASAVGKAGSSPFASMVDGLLNDAVQTARSSEATAAQQVAGKADLVDVVTAVNAAETALETLVAVRDRVISAYQDILRMPI